MKRRIACLVVASLFSVAAFSDSDSMPKQITVPAMDKVSYAMGVSLGKRFKAMSVQLDSVGFLQGLNDAMLDKQLKMTDAEMQSTIKNYKQYLLQKKDYEFQKAQTVNLQESDEFFQKNKTKSGVMSLPDGLQYKIIQEGNGLQPARNDMVTIDYTGKTLDGKVFDSSANAGKPIKVRMGFLVPGMAEALQKMKVGSTWEIYIPGKLGYGERGAPPKIGPNQALIFNVTLVDVKKL